MYILRALTLRPWCKHIQLGVSSLCNGYKTGLRNHSVWVWTPVALLHSLSDKYPWERYEPLYPPSYALNCTTTVFLEGWIWDEITQEGWYDIKQLTHMYIYIYIYIYICVCVYIYIYIRGRRQFRNSDWHVSVELSMYSAVYGITDPTNF